MASTKQAQVVITANATTAKKVMDELKNKAKQCYNQMQQLAQTGLQNSKAFKMAEKDFNAYNNAIAHNISATKRVDEVMKTLAGTSTRDLKRALGAAKRELNEMAGNNPKLKQMQKNIAAIKNQIDKNNGSVRTHNSLWKNAVKNITAYIGVFGAFNLIRSKLQGVISDNLKFSDQLNDIRKVSGLTTAEVNKLAVNLSKLDTRSTIQSLAQDAYVGSKLGMGKYGVEGLESFVKAANQVKVALAEDMGPESLTALAKMTETMGLIPKFGVEKSMLKIGSALFKLSSTTTSSSNNIVEFSKRLVGTARVAGVTTDQLLALGSAADSMQLMPEVASTAFTKLFVALQKNHNLIEKVLNIEPGTINRLFTAGRTMDAVVLILEKMKAKGNMNALQDAFEKLGGNGSRLGNVMVTMAKNVDMLKEHLQTAKVAFREGTAATQEYEMQQESAQAILERANNMWEKSFVNPKGVSAVKDMAQAWYDFSKSLTESSIVTHNISFFLTMLAGTVKTILTLLPALVTFFLFKGVSFAVLTIVESFRSLKDAIMASAIAQRFRAAADREEAVAATEAKIAQEGLNKALYSNVFGLVIAAIVSLIYYIVEFTSKTKDATTEMSELDKQVKNTVSSFTVEKATLDALKDKIDKANIGTKARADLIKEFNSKYGTYLGHMLTEKSTAEDLAKAYKKVVDQLKEKAVQEGIDKYRKSHYDPYAQYEVNHLINYDTFAKKNKLKTRGADLRHIVEDAGRNGVSLHSLAMSLGKRFGLDSAAVEDLYRFRSGAPTMSFDSFGRSQAVISGEYYAFLQYKKRGEQFLKAMKYATQAYSNKGRSKDVANVESVLRDKINVATDDTPDNNGSLDLEAPDKAAIKAARKAAQEANARRKKEEREARQAKRYELKDAQEDVKAIVDNVKNYYDRQITALYKIASATDMEESLRDQLEAGIKARMNIALSNARKSIADVKNDWNAFKKTMASDLIEQNDKDGYNESKVLLDRIGKVNIGVLRGRITQLSKDLKRPGTSLLDQVWHNASKNEQVNAKSANKVEQARRQKILEDDYTGKVDNDYLNTFEQLAFSPFDALRSQAILSGGENARDIIRTRNASIQSIFENSRANFDALQMLNIDSMEGRQSLLDMLFGSEDERSSAVVDLGILFDTLSEGAKVGGKASDGIRLFYDTLIKYNDDYTDALKKAADRQEKLLSFRWNHTNEKAVFDSEEVRLSQQKEGILQFTADAEQRRDEGDNTTENHGVYGNWEVLQSFGTDPEVELYKVKMQAAQAYYEYLKAAHADEAVLASAEKRAQEASIEYTKSLVLQMKNRMDELYSLFAPIESFGSELGESLVSSEKTVKQAVGGMINSFLKLTVNMMQETIKRRMFQLINDRLVSTQMAASAKEQETIEMSKQEKFSAIDKGGQKVRKMSFKEFAQQIFGLKKKNKKKEVSIETDGVKDERKVQKKGVKSLLKSIKSNFASLFRTKKKQKKQERKLEEKSGKETLEVSKEAEIAKQTLTEASGQTIQQSLDKTAQTAIQTQKTQAAESVQTKSGETQAKTAMGITSGAADIIGKLGWWGIPLVAVITALLNGLLSAAMGKVSSLFGGGSKSSDASTNTKLVSGMLTYDAGNVQAFRGVNDGKTYPVVGNDGQVYAATEAGELSTGLIKDPITTLINGQPALVAERGPEMVIGRETTAALMMARPDLISEIVRFDKNRSGMSYRAYDSGNVAQFSVADSAGQQAQIMELGATIAQLSSVLSELQKNGIKAHVNKFGRGGLTDAAADGRQFMSRYSKNGRYE